MQALLSSDYYIKDYVDYVSYSFTDNEINDKEGYICDVLAHENYIPDLTDNTLKYIINPSLIEFDDTKSIEIYNDNLYKQLDIIYC